MFSTKRSRYVLFAAPAVLLAATVLLQAGPRKRTRPRSETGQAAIAGQAQTADMSYTAALKKPPLPRRGGGLTGRMNRVTDRIVNAGAAPTATSSLSIRISSVLKLRGDQSGTVTLKVGAPLLKIDPKTPAAKQAGLNRDKSAVMAALKAWTYKLTAAQVKQVKSPAGLSIPLGKPFEVLSLFSKPSLVLKVVAEMPREAKVQEVRFAEKIGEKFVPLVEDILRYDEEFYIEVIFDSSPRKNQPTVTLEIDGLPSVSLTVKRTRDDPKIFRSEVQVLKRPPRRPLVEL